MQLIRGLINLNKQISNCVATIGNFDGVHLGHQAIIRRVIEQAKESGFQSCVILFEPHPKEVFMGDNCPVRITRFAEKYRQLKKLGIDKLLVLKFNHSFSQMKAEDFIQQVLIKKLKVKHLVVGDDFHFGYQRQGNYQLLSIKGKGYYTVEPTSSVVVNTDELAHAVHRVSSTLVRNALFENNFDLVEKLLARKYSMEGKVGYGKQLGRTLGFATANLLLNHKKLPLSGVYLVKASWDDKADDKQGDNPQQDNWSQQCRQKDSWGVANCGLRPTVGGGYFNLETHLLNVSPDLYGKKLTITFYAFLRDEKKFSNIELLTQQIKQDIKQAEKLIEELSTK